MGGTTQKSFARNPYGETDLERFRNRESLQRLSLILQIGLKKIRQCDPASLDAAREEFARRGEIYRLDRMLQPEKEGREELDAKGKDTQILSEPPNSGDADGEQVADK